jgi:hypothetical protein
MKKSILIYTIGLILFAASIILMVFIPDSRRIQLIAGGLTFMGFLLNIAGFAMKRTESK